MILLDTHAVIFWLSDDRRLSRRARNEIRAADEVLLSSVSGWEIATKHRIGKLHLRGWLPEDLPTLLEKSRIDVLAVSLPHAIQAGTIGGGHRDPFDRLLIAQSQVEDLPIVSADPVFEQYGVEVIW